MESESEGLEIFEKISTVSSKFLETTLSYLGSVQQDKNASMAVIEQKPIIEAYPQTFAAKDIERITAKLMGNETSQSTEKTGLARVFIKFFKSKKRIG